MYTDAKWATWLFVQQLVQPNNNNKKLSAQITLIQACFRHHMPNAVWDEIANHFPNFNDGTFDVLEWISNFTPGLIMGAISYPCWD